ncbi:MAG: ribbon-helix-helix domain-containing protein [Myxococcota bacterium]
MAKKKISTTVYITEEQKRKLELLHQKTNVPIAVYIRQGIDLVLDANKDKLAEQINLPGQIGK